MRRTLCLLPFLLAVPVYCAEESALVDLLPSESQIVFGVKVHGVLNSELARNLTAEMKGQAAEWQKMIALSGFDLLNDLEEVLIASTGAGEKAPTLIVARGKFEIEKLTPNADVYNGVRLVTSRNPQAQGVYGFLNETTAIAGDPETVKATIDHRGEPGHLDPALASQIAEYREHYDVWAVVNRAEGLAKLVPKSSGAGAGLDAIDHFQFGVSMQKGLELAAEVHARTAKDAEQLATTLQFLDAMTKASQQNGTQGTKFAYKNESGTLKISLAVSEEELKRTIETQRKAGLMFGARPVQAPPKAAVAAPPPVSAQPVLPAMAAEQPLTPAPAAPKAAPAPPKPSSPDDGRTAVFTLPSRP